MSTRIKSAAVAIVIAVILLIAHGTFLFNIAVGAISALAIYEIFRTHANSELVDLYSAGFRRNKVTKLVYYYDSFKDQYCK